MLFADLRECSLICQSYHCSWGLQFLSFLFSSYENKQLPDILTSLLSRVKLSDIQLAAARCNSIPISYEFFKFLKFRCFFLPAKGLTYIHRSDSLTSTDPRIVYRTLPCLARLCTNEFDEETRATAAETLAYLAEVYISTSWCNRF